MARKRNDNGEAGIISAESIASDIQRPAAEVLHAAELARLAARDTDHPRPRGWKLSPQAVVSFVLGDDKLGISPKFVGSRSFIERCVVALATNRGLMLIGEPGTAKTWLSELLAAAISGDSTLTIQGSAGTTEDSIKYSWNYALLLAEGPSERSLVPRRSIAACKRARWFASRNSLAAHWRSRISFYRSSVTASWRFPNWSRTLVRCSPASAST